MKHLTALVICMSLSLPVDSATINVPAEQSTIQAGIYAALEGDTVLVAAGTYIGEGNRDIDFNGLSLLLLSDQGPSQTVIDCQGTQSDQHRAFLFVSGEDSTTVVDGFTITNAYIVTIPWNVGAAIHCDSAAPTIRNCRIVDNDCIGLWCSMGNSTLRIDSCLFSGNKGMGGAHGGVDASNHRAL